MTSFCHLIKKDQHDALFFLYSSSILYMFRIELTIHHQEAYTVYAAYAISHVVHLQGSGVKHNIPEDQRPLVWKTFGDSFV